MVISAYTGGYADMMKEKRRNDGCVLFSAVAGLMIIFMLSGCGSDHVSYEPADVTDNADVWVTEQQTDESSEVSENTGYVYVYVCGAVKQEGVYQLPEDSRINDALLLAGGLTEDAVSGVLNLAETVQDGQKLYFPTKDELADQQDALKNEAYTDSQMNSSGEQSQKIDINTADKEQLMALSGIGETKAESIIRYRTEHGSFAQIEEITNVDGIGESLFQKIKEYIYVK